jgi:hypothetical protein
MTRLLITNQVRDVEAVQLSALNNAAQEHLTWQQLAPMM